jgi:uncharacterized membrane protein YccC
MNLHSVWLRNSLRGAAGMALAVAIVEITSVNHGFWVILGAMSVLRSNALGTGATAVRAVAGTAAGFFVGAAVMVGVGDHTAWLWGVLPVAVLIAGIAPSVISFTAGQGGFTVVVVILFNIIKPIGWKVGLTRIEDVAIGCGVSLVVGLLFWPRGASAALGRALCEAYALGSEYLLAAADTCTALGTTPLVDPIRRRSGAAVRRLDDAFRQYLGERGSKRFPIQTVTDLCTGAVRTRLVASSLAALPRRELGTGEQASESLTEARESLHRAFEISHQWYLELGAVLAGRHGSAPATTTRDPELREAMRAVARAASAAARDGAHPEQAELAVRVLWVDQSLRDQLGLQQELATTVARLERDHGRHRSSGGRRARP